MFQKYILALSLAFTSMTITPVLLSSPASAKLDCGPYEGKWVGKMQGKFSGKTRMTVKKCRTKWVLPDNRVNVCKYKEKKGKVEYICSLGSHGIVEVNGNKILMKNVFTAKRHGAYTVNFAKAN